MGQKINPISLRLSSTNRNFDNCWYSNTFYKNLINKDIILQHYLNNFLKLLKFPTGRYSIQHLQKKTQVFNFFCNSKKTRQWRSQLFGLTKKKSFYKKTRYFFKSYTHSKFKNRRKKYTKFQYFFKTINQRAIHKIQKRITSFQNFRLWSLIQTQKNLEKINNYAMFLPVIKNSTNKLMNLSGFCKQNFFQNLSFKDFIIKRRELCEQSVLIQKINQSKLKKKITNQQKKFPEKSKKFLKLLLSNHQKQQGYLIQQKVNLELSNNLSLLFLQNLFIYKAFKLYLKKQNQTNLYKNQLPNVLQNTSVLFPIRQNRKIVFNTLDSKYKNYLENSLSSLYKLELNLIPFKVKNDWQHANFLAEEIVYFLQKRVPFRRIKNKLLKQLSKISTIRGVRITCSGRVGGKSKKAQRAKTECFKYGQTSLQVFSSKIDFSSKTAFTSFGSVGVKVWICYY